MVGCDLQRLEIEGALIELCGATLIEHRNCKPAPKHFDKRNLLQRR